MIKDFCQKIRLESVNHLSNKEKLLRVFFILAIGLILGFLTKYIEAIPHFDELGNLLNMISNIFSRIGIWIFLATIIAALSRTPKAAALHVFSFFCGLLLTYYLYSMKIFGFFPTYYFLRWGTIALFSPLAACIVWYSRGNGWIAAFCASLPIGLLINQGSDFLSFSPPTIGFDLLLALILIITLPQKKVQILKILPLTALITLFLEQFNIMSHLIGGL